MLENGKMLGITCGTSIASKSKPAAAAIPEPLQPTLLQLTTLHWLWIDRFPFPDFRDQIIISSGVIEEEEFVEDLFTMEPFSLEPSAKTWDPFAYIMNPLYKAKWGYLFPNFPDLTYQPSMSTLALQQPFE
jgi:hypothetical protein